MHKTPIIQGLFPASYIISLSSQDEDHKHQQQIQQTEQAQKLYQEQQDASKKAKDGKMSLTEQKVQYEEYMKKLKTETVGIEYSNDQQTYDQTTQEWSSYAGLNYANEESVTHFFLF